MPVSSMAAKLLVLAMLSLGWLMLFQNSGRLNPNEPFHVATYHRDRRKALFYFRTVWIGLAAAFLSLVFQDGFSTFNFDSGIQKELFLGVTRAAGVWGLLIAAAVWTKVGRSIARVGAEGEQQLQHLPREQDQSPDDGRRRR